MGRINKSMTATTLSYCQTLPEALTETINGLAIELIYVVNRIRRTKITV